MENNLLYNAIENFSNNSGILIQIVPEKFPNSGNFVGLDGEITITQNSKIYKFPFVIKRNLTLSKLPDILNRLDINKLLIISDYIPKTSKEHLKEKGICYLDAAGNAFISDNGGLYLYIETNKTNRISEVKSNRAFSKSGLKVIFQILVNKKAVNLPYRSIAKLAKVSIDTVGRVIRELLRDKYLIQISDNEYKVSNEERLVQEWVTLFNKILRPKLRQAKFGFRDQNLKIQDLLEKAPKNSIGGELAAENLSQYLIAEKVIIYTENSFADLAKGLDLIPQKDGPITITESFWSTENANSDNVNVHPILVYADLLDSPAPRNLETAKMIYNQYVEENL